MAEDRRPRRPKTRPEAEPLEGRLLLAATFRDHQMVASARAGAAVVTLVRHYDTDRLEEFDLRTHDGTAVAGVDYIPNRQVVRFLPGETERSVGIGLHDENLAGAPKTVRLELTQISGAPPGSGPPMRSEAILTIVDRDDVRAPRVASTLLRADGDRVTAIVLRFDEAMDPATMPGPGQIHLHAESTQPGRPLPYANRVGSNGMVTIRSAVYDPAARTLTITPEQPLRASTGYRLGIDPYRGPAGRDGMPGFAPMTDHAGNALDGDGDGSPDGQFNLGFQRGSTLRFTQYPEVMPLMLPGPGRPLPGASVTLTLSGGGTLEMIEQGTGGVTPGIARTIRVEGAVPGRSVLSGSVRGRGVPAVPIRAIESPTPFVNRLGRGFAVGEVRVG